MTDRIEQLKKILESEPNDTFCLYGLAQEYAKSGDLESAAAHYRQVITIDPDQCYAYYHLAKVLEEADDEETARQVLREGLKRAQETGDEKALGEIAGYLDALT